MLTAENGLTGDWWQMRQWSANPGVEQNDPTICSCYLITVQLAHFGRTVGHVGLGIALIYGAVAISLDPVGVQGLFGIRKNNC